jgi:broad specificity phosphatase PhoE
MKLGLSQNDMSKKYLRPLSILVSRASLWLAVAISVSPLAAQIKRDSLAGETVLIVRHTEKPDEGIGLTPQGEARARAYAGYFEPFHEDGLSVRVDALYAGADSDKSIRPRLTLEPLQRATGLPLHTNIGTKDSAALVRELRQTKHGEHPLVAWRHSEIPALLEAFGASPQALLPSGK